MAKLLRILPLFLLIALVIAGCDFGKSPDMDKVKDVLMEEYGEEVYGDEASGEGETVEGTKSGTFEFGPECVDKCQEGFYEYMVIVWGDDWETEVEEDLKLSEYNTYLALRDEMGLGGGN